MNRILTPNLSVMLALVFFLGSSGQEALAANCGDTVAPCACGDTVTADFTMTANIVCPATFGGTALVIGGDGLLVEGNGFAIVADQAATMIHIGLHSNVTLQNIVATGTGNIPAKKFGVVVGSSATGSAGGHFNTIRNVDVSADDEQGRGFVFWSNSSNNTLVGSTANGKKIGIYLLQATNNTITGNTASFGTPLAPQNAVGIQLIGSSLNTLTGNTITSREVGINLLGSTLWGPSDTNLIDHNTVAGNVRGGGFIGQGTGNTWSNNDFSNSTDVALAVNGDSGFTLADNDYSKSAGALNIANVTGVTVTNIAPADLAGLYGRAAIRLVGVHASTVGNFDADDGTDFSLWLTRSTGNTITNVGAMGSQAGLFIERASDGNTFDRVRASASGSVSPPGTGFDIRTSQGNRIINSVIAGRQAGVSIIQGAGATVVDGNTLSGNVFAIQKTGSGQGNRYLDNDVSLSASFAVMSTGDDSVEITGNFFDGSAHGIFLSTCAGISLDGAALTNVTNNALRLYKVTDSVFSNLQLGGNWALYGYGGSNGNTFTNVHAEPTTFPAVSGLDMRQSDNNAFLEATVIGFPAGFRFDGNGNTVSCSRMLGNTRGLYNAVGSAGTQVHDSEVVGNRLAGVRNDNLGLLVATGNFWGDASGPAPVGTGDAAIAQNGPVDTTGFVSAAGDLDGQCGRRLPDLDGQCGRRLSDEQKGTAILQSSMGSVLSHQTVFANTYVSAGAASPGNETVYGNILANAYVTMGAGSLVTGDIQTGTDLTTGDSATVDGSTLAVASSTLGAYSQLNTDLRSGTAVTLGAN
ncbi:MAG: parallel beta-helix repeat protein, partial [Myxococcota bacterium]